MNGPRTLVKVCGIQDGVSARAAVEAGADLIGFHFCPSPRRVAPAEAAAIVRGLSRRPTVVGVFIDEEPSRAEEIAFEVGVDLLQLHGEESPGYPARHPVIKALKIRDGALPDGRGWPDPLLLDSWSNDRRGGTGRSWNWDLAGELIASRRVFVAGGLTAANVGDLVRRHRPHGVDVSSGVESEPGRKEAALVRAFVAAVRSADDDGG